MAEDLRLLMPVREYGGCDALVGFVSLTKELRQLGTLAATFAHRCENGVSNRLGCAYVFPAQPEATVTQDGEMVRASLFPGSDMLGVNGRCNLDAARFLLVVAYDGTPSRSPRFGLGAYGRQPLGVEPLPGALCAVVDQYLPMSSGAGR